MLQPTPAMINATNEIYRLRVPEIIGLIHEGNVKEAQALIGQTPVADISTLVTAIAHLVPFSSQSVTQLLEWMHPQHRPRRRKGRELQPCGTHAAFNRHIAEGLPRDQIDQACDVEERRYQAKRAQDRRDAVKATS